MSGQDTETVVLCFDALSVDYLDRFDLPNFSSLRSRGIESRLESTFPPWTGSAWPSMYTGTDPSTHGVYDFFTYDDRYPDESELVNRNDVDRPAIWNYLTARDRRSLVMNVPVTYPAEPVNGVMIPGYLAPEAAEGHPPGVRARLGEELGEYRIYSRAELGIDEEYSVADYVDLIDIRRRAAAHLLDTEPWDLAVLQVQKTDAVFHTFDHEDAYRRVYEAADDLVGTVLDVVDRDANVVVCSDHGMGSTDGYRIYLNQILENHDYLVGASGTDSLPMLKTEKERLTATGGGSASGGSPDDEDSSLGVRAFSTARSTLDTIGVDPERLAGVADRLGLLGPITSRFSGTIRESFERGVDWESSMAYCRSGNELGVRINLKRREPAGVVSPADYEAVRSDLVELLSGLETPDGQPAFEFVQNREDVYSGPATGDACDVLLKPRDMNHTIATNLMGVEFVPIDTHDHKCAGTFVGAGPAFDRTGEVDELSLTDVAPIVMALAGCPVPEGMTGTAPASMLNVEVTRQEYGEVPYGTGSTVEGVAGEVGDRLEDLGYL